MGDLLARMKVSHYSTDRQKAKDENQRWKFAQQLHFSIVLARDFGY